LVVVVHGHELPVVTVTVDVPPLAPTARTEGVTTYVQPVAVGDDKSLLHAHIDTRATTPSRSSRFLIASP
jgi:hypothetical protein